MHYSFSVKRSSVECQKSSQFSALIISSPMNLDTRELTCFDYPRLEISSLNFLNLILFSILTFWFSHLVFSCFSLLEHFHFNLQVFKSALTIPFYLRTPYTMFSSVSMFFSVPFRDLGKCNLYVIISPQLHPTVNINGAKVKKKFEKSCIGKSHTRYLNSL